MTKPFTMIDNKLILDTSLSGDSYRMISYLISKPVGWKLLVKDVMKTFSFCRGKVYRLIKEATEAGYLERFEVRSSGKYFQAYYTLPGQETQGKFDLRQREIPEHINHVTENDTWSKPHETALSDDRVSQTPCDVNQNTYIRKNTNTITTTHRSSNVLLEQNLQGEAADAAETDSLREPLKKENADLPTGKACNAPKGRDVHDVTRDKPQSTSCSDKIPDTFSAELARDENPLQAQQPSARASRPAKTDFLQKVVEKMRQAAGDAITDVMAKDFEPSRWLQGGCDLELDIIPIIAARCAKREKGSIFTWSFFTTAIEDRHFARTKPLAKVEHEQDIRVRGQNTRKKGGQQQNLSVEAVRTAVLKARAEREMRIAA